jgi:hypothetical protein
MLVYVMVLFSSNIHCTLVGAKYNFFQNPNYDDETAQLRLEYSS